MTAVQVKSLVTEPIRNIVWPGRDREGIISGVHDVALRPGSRLHAAFQAPSIPANSMHHEAVKILAPALVATAHSADGLVEAIEADSDHFLVGVQRHPEMFEHRDVGTQWLFKTFVDAANRKGA